MPSLQAVGGNKALQAFRVAGLSSDFYYIPNFISVEEEVSILQKIPAQRWTQLTHRRLQAVPSTLTKNNTLLGAPLPTYLFNPVVQRFKELGIFDETPHQQPNHVLINEYKPGEGIMPHEDGDAYAPVVATVSLGGALCLDIVNKASSSGCLDEEKDDVTRFENGEEMELKEELTEYKIPTRILQEPRSLLITTGDAYRNLMHGIASIEVDVNLNAKTIANWNLVDDRHAIEEAGGRNVRETRISLTYRDVLKVSSAASKVFGVLQKR
ncbi:alkB, alkylation repair protein 6 [Clathrospora elynae]|uniref:AlkB, alkylation repair protein 6 n=1 Tax=Clathrospora elynae TaxID=706981 RepID=A0A6A5S718_9PLEO|nr:alkB, alkylation repair protein 6 [Clathrospora elynae]